MGISAANARLLLDCRRRGLEFGRVLMLGRQNVYLSGPEFGRLLRDLGIPPTPELAKAVSRSGEFAEPFFRGLGATVVESMDASDFEGATHRHDLNTPVPARFREAYEVVYDGGTLEHVFDFPAALANAMTMVTKGGTLILHTPANNMMGHGLYQFSPELFFRLLGLPNGFQLERMLAVEAGVTTRWYDVVDPASAGVRGELANRVPVWLHVEARRIGDVPGRLGQVQQSDYATRWKAAGVAEDQVRHLSDPHHRVPAGLRTFLLRYCPGTTRRLERWVGLYLKAENSFRNRAAYRRFRG